MPYRYLLPALLLMASVARAQVPTRGLMAYYPLSDNTLDASGNNRHANAFELGYSTDGRGQAFSAGYSNGRSTLISGPVVNSWDTLTVSMLVKTFGPQTAPPIYIGSTAATGYGIRFSAIGGGGTRRPGQSLQILHGGVRETSDSNNVFREGRWQHLVLRRTISRTEIYLNGRFLLGTSILANLATSPVYICTEPVGRANWNDAVRGFVDEVRIYGRALSPQEIAGLAEADTTGLANTPQAVLSGSVFFDQNANCTRDAADLPYGGKTVLVQPGNLAVAAGDDGRFVVPVAPGTYTVRALPEPYLRVDSTCPTVVTLPQAGDTARVDVGIQGRACAMHNVHLLTWARQRCFETSGTVTVSNEGLAPAPAATLRLRLPEGIYNRRFTVGPTVIDTAGPGERYSFAVPALAPRQRFEVQMVDSTACRDSLRNQTLCTQAEVDVVPGGCLESSTGWDSSFVAVESACVGNNVLRFTVRNFGQAMADSVDYRLLGQEGLAGTGRLRLAMGDSLYVNVRDTLGQAYILEVDQRPGYPGPAVASTIGFGCGVAGTGPLRFAYGDGISRMEADEVCLPVTDSYDPNEIIVKPAGLGPDNIVRPGTPLEYVIYFQNEGSANTRFVILQDTLPLSLDEATFARGTESHPGARVRLYGYNGRTVVQYRWNALSLTPKAVNEARSQGFASFTMRPKRALPLGTQVSNRAGIYFDFNPVILTNTATIRYDNLPVDPDGPRVSVVTRTRKAIALGIDLYPNPTTGTVQVGLPAGTATAQATVYAMTGKALTTTRLAPANPALDLAALRPGIYFVRIATPQGTVVERVVKR